MFKRERIIVVLHEGRTLSEEQINTALAVTDDNPMWLAVRQLIMTAEDNANRNAQDNMDPPSVMAGYVGGASHLRMLRDELQDRRELGIKELGARRVTE